VVSALRVRANIGKLLNRVEDERRSLIIEKRSTPRAVLMSIRDYVKLAAPEPEVLRISGEESVKKGTNTLTSRQIDQGAKEKADDNMFLECADAARADYLITGNQRHFPRFWKKTKIITRREFISLAAPHLIT
jgi:prevent-host-death family protein